MPIPNPAKVNLGVGVYTDENGKLPLLACVRRGREACSWRLHKARGYLPIDGIAAYDKAVQGARVRRRFRRRDARPAASPPSRPSAAPAA